MAEKKGKEGPCSELAVHTLTLGLFMPTLARARCERRRRIAPYCISLTKIAAWPGIIDGRSLSLSAYMKKKIKLTKKYYPVKYSTWTDKPPIVIPIPIFMILSFKSTIGKTYRLKPSV
jgi:hypothetical protein